MSRPKTTNLIALLHGAPLVEIETGRGEVDSPTHIRTASDAWKMTGAWPRGAALTGTDTERWLRGIRPQNGARTVQEQRARAQLKRLGVEHAILDQADIIWGTPGREYAGALSFRSLIDGREVQPERDSPLWRTPLGERDLGDLVHKIIDEMRRGTTDPRLPEIDIPSPSGSLPKLAIHQDLEDGTWWLPTPDRPSTHIVKVEERAAMPAEAAAEAVCQRALRQVGIRACHTRADVVNAHQVVISTRSDRWANEATGRVELIHQEEWAAACGRDPDDLIERPRTGGGWADLHRFLMDRSPTPESEAEHLWYAIAALVVIGHRDIHRRNVGIRYERPGEPASAELAPLYDVCSMDGQRDDRWRSLALPIGGEEEIDRVDKRCWTQLANETRTDPETVFTAVTETARLLPDALATEARKSRDLDRTTDEHATARRLDAIVTGSAERAKRILADMKTATRALELPDWVPLVAEAQNDNHPITLSAHRDSQAVTIVSTDDDGQQIQLGHAPSVGAFCRALRRARLVPPEEIPELERSLERQRRLELAKAEEQSR